ncbi:3'-5' exonuclease [Alteromonas ponticola]|uniref:3'-5' exonuclease n=1 Tax=Alteromonas aquimaris TaxID=2998417 RepID=A0ABT3P600_9ALTE|nr:3'-5' exonuclease [Alteromonas aquimaris]MCW8108189.1 3'-5' exonuclease [Alteromonas aquimaris]
MFYLSKKDIQHKPVAVRDWGAYFDQQRDNISNVVLKRFYSQPPPAPNADISLVPLVALDLETTGLNWRTDSIVSMGLVEFSTRRIRLNSARYWVVKPSTQLKEQSILVHNLTHTEFGSAPSVSAILEKMIPLLAGKVVIAHHAAIERNFLLRSVMNAYHCEWYFPMIDTLKLERRLVFEEQPWWKRWLISKQTSLQLRDCRARYGLPAYRQHHALNDAIACAELFQAQISYLGEHIPLAELLDN